MNSQKIVIFLVILINQVRKSLNISMQSVLLKDAGFNWSESGNIIAFGLIPYIILLPIIGRLSDYYGRKNILLMCILTSIFGNNLFGNVGKSDYFKNVIFEIMRRMINNLSEATYLLVFSVLADISNPINRAKTFGLIGVAYVLSYVLQIPIHALIDGRLSYYYVSLINFFIILFFYKETNINVGIKTNFFEYFKFLSDPMIWSLLLITGVRASLLVYLPRNLKKYIQEQKNRDESKFVAENHLQFLLIGSIITFIVQGFLIGPLTNIFHLNQIILFGLICVIISLFVYYFLNEQNTNNTISVQKILIGIFSVGLNLVLPCLCALIINKYNYINYGTIIGFLLGLKILSDRLNIIFTGILLDSSISYPSSYLLQSLLMIASFILFLISKKSGVNLIT